MRALVLCLAVVGCADSVEDHASIDQGVYGRYTTVSDTKRPDFYPPNVAVTAFELTGGRFDEDKTDGDGFYQLALPPGTYIVCTGGDPESYAQQGKTFNCSGGCARFGVPEGLVRVDYISAFGNSHWTMGDQCP